MKTTIKTIILAAASLFAAMSCQKETAGTQDLVKEGETIRVSINAGLGDFVAADATKATAESVIRLKWTSSDVVQAYCGTDKISTGDGLTVTPSENGIFAKLSGEIDATSLVSGTSVITFVYSNVNNTASTGEAPTFNFSTQNTTDIPFVAYATLVYDGAATLTDKMVEFKFATSVMKIAVANLDGGAISSARIDGINTEVTLTPHADSETVGISGGEAGTITKTDGIAASTDKTRAIFTVGLVPEEENSSRELTINGKKAALTSSAIAASKSYTTPCAFASGSSDEDEYVVMKMGTGDSAYTLKWAKKNLGASGITGYGDLYSWGEVEPKFDYSSNKYEQAAKDINQDLTKAAGNDVANAVKGGKWRMPTSQEFKDLYDGCGGTYDKTTKPTSGKPEKAGVYWCNNYNGVAGCLFYDGNNLLFFPAAGFSNGTSRSNGGAEGDYWSSTWASATNACSFGFYSGDVIPQGNAGRSGGRSVRPVLD